PDMVTSYEYLNKPAWAFPTGYLGTKLTIPSNDTGGTQVIEAATWNESRGYPNVRRLTGSGTDPTGYTVDTHSFLRGMYDDKYADGTLKRTTVTDFDGNAVDDRRWLAGQELENRSWKMTTYSSDPAQRQYTELEAVRHEFARQVTGDGPGVLDPSVVNPVRSRARETLADGSYRYTDSRTGYDAFGLPITRNDYGQDGLADNTCTRTTYVRNTALWMMSYPATTEEHAGDDCTNGTVIGRTTNLYDGGTDPATNQPTNGNITESRSWTDATHVSVTKGSFDNYGRMRSGTDALGKTTTTTYSPAVNWPVNGVVMTNPLGQQATTWPNRLHGGATEVIDPDGKMTEVDYDALGRTTAVWGPADPRSGGTPSATMTYTTTYDGGIGQPTAPAKTTTQTLQSGTGGTAKWFATYAFDDGWGRDRETQTASPSGGRIVTAAAYDARGLTNVTSEPVHNGSTPGSGLLNPAATDLPSWTKHIHDGAERATATAEESYATELRRTSYVQAGADLQSVVPPAGGATDYVSDAGDRVTKAVEWVYWGVSQTTLFEYDLDGNLTKITDANGNVRTFQYDWAGRRIASHDPDAGDSTYTYDAGGQLLSTVDGRGQKISNSYDDLGRITAVWSGDADTGTKLVERRYDTIAKGQLTSATSFVGGNAYTDEILAYDENHRPTSTRLTIPGSEGLLAGTYTFTAAYDKAGHQTETGMPAAGGLAAEKVTASFTGLGYADRLTSDYGGLSIYVNSSTYSKTGRLTERRYGSRGQVKRNLAWDDATNRLTNVATLANADTATPVKAQDDDFYYDAADNIVRITDKTTTVGGVLTPQSECFNYDTRNRLIFAWTTTQADCSAGWWYSPDWKGPDPYWRAFTYDSVGNITSQDTAGHKGDYTYPTPGASSTRPNAVSKVTWPERTDTYTYGPAGELASRNVAGKTTTFDWDPLGRLSRAVTDGQATDNVYDADGDRLIRRDPGRTTLYLGQMELVLAGGQVTARRYYTAGDGATVAVRTAGTLTWLLADPQRSEQIAIDNATGHVDRQRYLPFGARRGGRDDITVTQRGYLGKTEDDATGLISLDARFYDPTIGKFTSPDALLDLRMPEWSNPYAYAGNNPTTFSDPHGLRLLCGTGDEPACPKKKPKPPKKKKPTFRCPTERCADDRIEAACDKACHKKRDAATKKAIESYKATHFKCPTERCADDRIEAACDKACHDARDKATKDAVDDIKRYKKEEAEKKEGGFWDKLTSNPIWKAAKVGLSMAAFVCQVCGLVAAGMSIVDMAVKASHGDVVGALIEGAGYFGGVVGPMAKIVAQGAKAASKGLGNISRAAKGINWKGETWRNAAGRKVAGWVGTKTANGAARAGRVERRADVTADVADVTGHYAAVGASIRDTVNENGE
ncbi:MAG TPA: RHS repeat-associated core domain-containing protein, partial [Micromonosporaceae bacterium]|nr:RHS repeat-associated core domain-containing protein [Micromonosporaceae bacterium]